MAVRGKAVGTVLDFLGMSSAKAAPYIDAGKGKSAKYLARAGSAFDKGVSSGAIRTSGIPSVVAQQRAETVRNAAIRARQFQVGRRYAAGGVALGGVGMYRNRSGSRGGYSPPSMRTAKGSGRYA